MVIRVKLKTTEDRSYDIHIEWGIRKKLRNYLETLGNRQVFYIWDKEVYSKWRNSSGIPEVNSITWNVSEEHKRLYSVEALAQELVYKGADRKSLFVAIGGGVTGDVVGFLASIFMRGVPVVQVPTTLVAQVDSSIGGKTGVDLPAGKNLIGTFHQPFSVFVDPEFLTSLPEETFNQGMAEVIKTAWIGDPELLDILEKEHKNIRTRKRKLLEDVISRCIQVKARIVMEDEKEGNIRRVLNFGHTFGHAIEKVSKFTVPHGNAIAIGMRCALFLANALKITSEENVKRLEKLLELYDLPLTIPNNFNSEDIINAFYADKKKEYDKIVFVVSKEPGEVSFYQVEDPSFIKEIVERTKK